ncbi:protealysin inhibitor emfourin [Leptolyngbya sp. O-77]|uniref:protealysin inhibitor emfourin n=1 Tax=Leptolyngbya sp. O-77 TaxID=1080068 RepID=UPI000839261B|nr:protealysin inhibitor emfourin [Leptolyngbya sp. O-77]
MKSSAAIILFLPAMRIDFQSSGGFANLQLAYSVDTRTLRPGEASELEALVRQSNVMEMQPGQLAAASAGPPDVMTYRLELQEGDRHQSLTITDLTAPPSLQPLLSRLRDLALEHR